MTAAALLAAFYIRFEEQRLSVRIDLLWWMLPPIVIYAGIVYYFFHLDDAKWRFASLPDLCNIFRAATVLALSLLVLDYILVAPNFYGTFFFGKITIVLYWVLQMFFLGGPRIAYRYFRYSRARSKRDPQRQCRADPDPRPRRRCRGAAARDRKRRGEEDLAGRHPVAVARPISGQSIRGVPVLGNFDDLETRRVAILRERGTDVRARGADAVGVRAGYRDRDAS